MPRVRPLKLSPSLSDEEDMKKKIALIHKIKAQREQQQRERAARSKQGPLHCTKEPTMLTLQKLKKGVKEAAADDNASSTSSTESTSSTSSTESTESLMSSSQAAAEQAALQATSAARRAAKSAKKAMNAAAEAVDAAQEAAEAAEQAAKAAERAVERAAKLLRAVKNDGRKKAARPERKNRYPNSSKA